MRKMWKGNGACKGKREWVCQFGSPIKYELLWERGGEREGRREREGWREDGEGVMGGGGDAPHGVDRAQT
jgi:hypothetical protein